MAIESGSALATDSRPATEPSLIAKNWITSEADKLSKLERELIESVATARKTDTPDKWLGLALSGGGVRSASFALGVLQSLHNWDLFRRIDYLSTVSGGGYIGASLTYFLQYKGLGPFGEFPFGELRQGGARSLSGIQQDNPDKEARPQPKAIVSFLRQHAHYLTPTPALNWFAFFATALRAVFTSLVVYFPLLLALMVLDVAGAFSLRHWAWLMSFLNSHPVLSAIISFEDARKIIWINWPVALVLAVLAVAIGNALGFAWRTSGSRNDPAKRSRIYPGIAIDNAIFNGCLMVIFIAAMVLSILPWIVYALGAGWNVLLTSSASALVGYVGTLVEFRSRLKGLTAGNSAVSQARPIIFAILAVIGLLVLSYGLGEYVVAWSGGDTSLLVGPLCAAVLILLSLIINSFCNLNYVSQHRMYRDRLMETFCPPNPAVARQEWRPSEMADTLPLSACRPRQSEIGDAGLTGPYHLINTALVIPGSKKTLYRARGSDNFILSPLACGSNATGWRDTTSYMKNAMNLPTAMAISGAALNAHSGCGERSSTRDAVLSFLITLFGAQLGYWAQHPRSEAQLKEPNFLWPGWRGLTGIGLDDDPARGFVQLADGGHFENLGLYELLRRQMDVIIVSDAGQDQDFCFEDLGIAVERARVDFGLSIDFPLEEIGLAGILPGSDESDDQWTAEFNLSKHGFAIGRIRYRDPVAKIGHIVFIKATLIDGLPADLYSYRRLNKDFPDQTTADQDFDEYQFEAYRELGCQLVNQLFIKLFGSAGNQKITLQAFTAALSNQISGTQAAPAAN